MEPSAVQSTTLILEARDRLLRLAGPELERTKWSEQNLQRDVQVIVSKLDVWKDTWLSSERHPNVSLEILWGIEGWTMVRASLSMIEDRSSKLESCMGVLKAAINKMPRERWKKALRHVRLKRQTEPVMTKIRELLDDLNSVIDGLWLHSEITFDSLHNAAAQKSHNPGHNALLRSALRSRSGSLQLYRWCCELPLDVSLGLDMVGPSSCRDLDDATVSSFYRLFAQTSDDSKQLTQCEVEVLPDSEGMSKLEDSEDPKTEAKVRLFETFLAENKMTCTDSLDAGQCSSLRISKTTPRDIRLKTSPESLEQILVSLKKSRTLTRPEHLSIGAKVELAFKLVEAGLFLLGTPWFSSLGNGNILRLKNACAPRHVFILEIQSNEPNDLISEDAGALAETTQLSRLGILLTQIALDGPFSPSTTRDSESESNILDQLPLVEQAMGAQYCKATAFCLQPRQSSLRFQGPGKYNNAQFKGWEAHLEEMLESYYSQVFLRLQELQQIDTKSEYRSRKSEEMEHDNSG